MSILTYIRSLSPTYERKELLAALSSIDEEITHNTLPASAEMASLLGGKSLTSPLGKTFTRELQRVATFSTSPVVMAHNSLLNIQVLIPEIESQVKKAFSFQFTTYKMSFERVNLMRLIETLGFYVRYHRKFMLQLIAHESNVAGKATPQRWSKAELQWLSDGLKPYATLFPIMMTPVNEFKSILSQVSNAEIDSDTLEIAETSLGIKKIDPFRIERNFTADVFGMRVNSPFLALGKARAEYQAKRYKAAKEEHQALQLRLLEYKSLTDKDGTLSPKHQSLIEHTESRIEKLDYHLSQIEEDNRYEDTH